MQQMTEHAAQLVSDFDALQRRLSAHAYAFALMEYDSQTVLPVPSAPTAAACRAELYAEHCTLLASQEVTDLVGELVKHESELDEVHRRALHVLRRQVREMTAIPLELSRAYRDVVARAFPVWREAKRTNDFGSFAPYLDQIFTILREEAACLDLQSHPYDVWLDHWEHGSSMHMLDAFFQLVSDHAGPLVHQIMERRQDPDPAFVHAYMPAAEQEVLAAELAEIIGLDAECLRFGRTVHACTTSMCSDDVRIAHCYPEHAVLDGVATSMHEGGHALYDQNVDRRLSMTLLSRGMHGGMHEGQSRLMENMVGRSEAFSHVLLPLLRRHNPEVYNNVSEYELYAAMNRVRPTLVRTSADELTYPFHIMVRYECERRLMAGDIAAAEVPSVWNELMKQYLGLTVPDDTHGCLQDMHWASDYVGYFQSYALGNAYAAQLVACARRDRSLEGVNIDASMAEGDVHPLTSWLRDRVWRFGASKEPQEILQNACGEPFDPMYYLTYLTDKYTHLYQLV